MSKNTRPLESPIDHSSVSGELMDKIETYLNHLLKAEESDPGTLEVIHQLARELDENQTMAEFLLKKIKTPQENFFPWFLPILSQQIQSKSVKKGIKKTLYLLQQRGIEIPLVLDQQQKPEGGILKYIEPDQAVGYLSEFDGLKNQMLGLLIPKRTKGRLFVFALINSQGLESLTVLEVSKKEVRDIIGDLEGRSGLGFLEADLSHTAFVLKEAHDRHSQLSQENERAYLEIIKSLDGKKTIGHFPIIRTLLDQEHLAPYSSDLQWLLKIPEIFYLLPEPEVMESYFQAVQEVRTGILILNEIQQSERLLSIVEKAVQESFPPEKRAGLWRYLEEVAYLYLLKKKSAEAVTVYYWANTLSEAEKSQPDQENRFLRWLMETVLLAQETADTPRAETKEKTTDGGIIIPGWVGRGDSR